MAEFPSFWKVVKELGDYVIILLEKYVLINLIE